MPSLPLTPDLLQILLQKKPTNEYYTLAAHIQQLTIDQMDTYIPTMQQNITKLANGTKQKLVQAFFERKINAQNTNTLQKYIQLCIAAVSACSHNTAPYIIQSIVWEFQTLAMVENGQESRTENVKKIMNETTSADNSEWSGDESDLDHKPSGNSRDMHHLLQRIIQIAPNAAKATLPQAISYAFPRTHETIQAHQNYAKNILSLAEYMPELRTHIVQAMIQKMLHLDVTILQQLQPSSLAYNESRAVTKREEEEEDLDSDDDLFIERTEEEKIHFIRDTAEKLEQLMHATFNCIERKAAQSHQTEFERFFDALLLAFDQNIIKTHRCRITQFLLFYAASLNRKACDLFTSTLFEHAFNKLGSDISRCAALGYIASYTARAAYLSPADVEQTISQCINAAHRSPPRAVFYSLVQAIMYIFAFRWKCLFSESDDSIGDPRQRSWWRKLEALIEHPWKPLKVAAILCYIRNFTDEMNSIVQRTSCALSMK